MLFSAKRSLCTDYTAEAAEAQPKRAIIDCRQRQYYPGIVFPAFLRRISKAKEVFV